jgi:hypothetical protein
MFMRNPGQSFFLQAAQWMVSIRDERVSEFSGKYEHDPRITALYLPDYAAFESFTLCFFFRIYTFPESIRRTPAIEDDVQV